MSTQQIDYQELLQLIELIKSSSQFTEFKLRSGDLELELRRGAAGAPMNMAATAATQVAAESAAPAPPAPPAVPARAQEEAQRLPDMAAKPAAKARAQGSVVIRSPMVGTVYRAAEPGAVPFVKAGQKVAPSDQICIIEVMKLMNSINADCHGVVTEILVADGEAVEYGQELFVISTS